MLDSLEILYHQMQEKKKKKKKRPSTAKEKNMVVVVVVVGGMLLFERNTNELTCTDTHTHLLIPKHIMSVKPYPTSSDLLCARLSQVKRNHTTGNRWSDCRQVINSTGLYFFFLWTYCDALEKCVLFIVDQNSLLKKEAFYIGVPSPISNTKETTDYNLHFYNKIKCQLFVL